MTPCYTFLGIFYLNNAEFTDGNFFDVFLSDSNEILICMKKYLLTKKMHIQKMEL